MVAQITEGTALDKHGRPFRRRSIDPESSLPVSCSSSPRSWAIALTRPVDVREVAACNPPPALPTPPHRSSASRYRTPR